MSAIQIRTNGVSTPLDCGNLTHKDVQAAARRAFPGQFVEVSMWRVTRTPWGDVASGVVREGGTTGGRVLAALSWSGSANGLT